MGLVNNLLPRDNDSCHVCVGQGEMAVHDAALQRVVQWCEAQDSEISPTFSSRHVPALIRGESSPWRLDGSMAHVNDHYIGGERRGYKHDTIMVACT